MKMRPQKLISKIENEFQQIKVLGIGSFGKVFSVQHLLDQQIYAIKKIGIDGEEMKFWNMTMKAIEIWAKFNFKYIIQYKTSWIERQISCIQMEI